MKNKSVNKIGKKLLALILSVSMVFSVVSIIPAFAVGEVYGILTNNGKVYNCDSEGENIGTTEIARGDVTHLFIAGDVETIRGPLFNGCTPLKTVDLSKAINLKSIENDSNGVGGTFTYCTNLETVILPKNLVTLCANAFRNCEKLADMTFLSKTPPTIGNLAFQATKYQMRVHIPVGSNANEWKSVLEAKGAFNPVIIVNNKYGIYKKDGNAYECDENAVATEVIADKKAVTYLFIANDVTTIKNKAFLECGNLIEVNFSNATNLTSIGNNTFAGCVNLETIKIPDTVTSIGEFAFANCKSLNAVTLPKNITKIGNSTFIGCNKLARIEIPQKVTEIDIYAFYNCQNLSTVSFSRILPPTLGMSSFESTKDGINVVLNNTADENIWREKLIAAGMTNPKVAKDITPPTAEIKVGDTVFNSSTTDIPFDMLLKDNQKITITASDTASSISKIEYQNVKIERDYDVNGLWKPYTDAFEADHLGVNIIYARVTDLAGNQTIINSNGFIVYAESMLQTEVTEFDRKEENQRNLFVGIILNGNTLKSITNGETVLKEGTDYIIDPISPQSNFADYPESSSLILNIQKSYLAKLPSGIQTLTFNYDPHGIVCGLVISTPLEITIKDTGHIHDFNTEFTIERESTCSVKGEKSKHCKDFALCGGKAEITEVEFAPHTVPGDAGKYVLDDDHHWTFCKKCNQQTNFGAHTTRTEASYLARIENKEERAALQELLGWNIDAYNRANYITNRENFTYYFCTVCNYVTTEKFKINTEAIPIKNGNGLVYTIGTTGGATFTSIANINGFLKVSIDGMQIKLGDIKLKEGSTIVTISSEYMDTLPNGQHTVEIYSTTGTATANFTVVGNKEIVTPETPKTPTTPTTGDTTNLKLWTNLLLISGIFLTLLTLKKATQKSKTK